MSFIFHQVISEIESSAFFSLELWVGNSMTIEQFNYYYYF